jgi:hypothetical protein
MTTPHTIGGNPLTAVADRRLLPSHEGIAGHREITPFVRVQLTPSGVNLAMSKRPRQQKEPLVSTLMDAEIVNVIVSTFRILRPILTTASVVPLFLEKVTTHSTGLTAGGLR